MTPVLVSAHIVDVGQGSVNLVGEKVFLAMSLPAAAFSSADDNADGTLDSAEIKTHQQELISRLQSGLRLMGDGRSAVWRQMVLSPVSVGTSAPGSLSPQLAVLGFATWDEPPKLVTLDYNLWPTPSTQAPFKPGTPLETIKVRMTRTQDGQAVSEEAGLLSHLQPRLEFFAPVHRHLVNFAHHGFNHIMSGADHLVFLVALLASGISVRRWAALLTAFTLAHGLTFGLASFGWISVPEDIVEPAIAASIVCIAALHLLQVKIALRTELLLVLGLGLVHGLGFANAMQDMGGSQLIALNPSPMWCILGFNIGIELGQLAVALALGVWVWGFRLIVGTTQDFIWQRAAGIGALIIGIFWLIERMIQPMI
jgi:hydrogenase/urease accessory protein HupE